MKYVSAKWQNSPIQPSDPTIVASGDDGQTYYIPSEDCDVPPWPEYLAEGGTIEPADPPEENVTYPPPEEPEDANGPAVQPEE